MTLEIDPDRRLALAYVRPPSRAPLEALWRLDVSMGSVVATGREPMISRIRLAWWRESLEKLDRAQAPAEPVLRAIADLVLPAAISGAELSEMEQGWAVLLTPEALTDEEMRSYAADRGGRLFRLSARLLGEEYDGLDAAGSAWALADLARHSGEPDASRALELSKTFSSGRSWPVRLRPLGMLAALARRDGDRGTRRMEPQGAPARMVRMLRHRLTGS